VQLTAPAGESRDQTLDGRGPVPVDLAQIDLTNLSARWAVEREPRASGCNRRGNRKIKSQLDACLLARNKAACA
jgi:hypothetical protein